MNEFCESGKYCLGDTGDAINFLCIITKSMPEAAFPGICPAYRANKRVRT